MDEDDDVITIRASWRFVLMTPVVFIVVILLFHAAGRGQSLRFDVGIVVAFTVMSVFSIRGRRLELRPDAAVARGLVSDTWLDRDDVTEVRRGGWWRGGVVVAGPHRRLWSPVGDRLTGGVSDETLGVITRWATTPS